MANEDGTLQEPGGATAIDPGPPRESLLSPLKLPPSGAAHACYPTPHRHGSRRLLRQLSLPGLTLALVFLWVALSPSLLPRVWWVTAVNVGVSLTYGYVIGDLLGRFFSWLARRADLRVELNARSDWALRVLWLLLLVVASIAVWSRSVRQQHEIMLMAGVPRGGPTSQLVGVLVGVALFALLILIGRGILRLWRGVQRLIDRVLPRFLVPAAATALVAALILFVSNDVVYRNGMNWALGNAQQLNQSAPEGRTAPTESERSGSPTSLESWDSLGRDGQSFVADGPRASDITAATGATALEPIRIYTGKMVHDDPQEAAEAAVADLVRAGGLDRSIVHVTTSTGTGFVQEWSMQALEYLTGGDVATISMQYSYFPSGLAYVSDRDTPPLAGQALFEAVEAEVRRMPEGQQPRIFASGESLGSFGGQGAFDSAEDMIARVDGAMWTGTPRFTPLWTSLTESRREGSPEIAPVIDNGRHIRFATVPEELAHDFYGGPFVEWEEPRIVYGQHSSDPVVWWSPDLLFEEPDWLREQVGRDVSPDLEWSRWVTFWQLATDMPLAVDVPSGHGHEYKAEMIPLWAGVLGLDPTADYTDLINAVDSTVIVRGNPTPPLEPNN